MTEVTRRARYVTAILTSKMRGAVQIFSFVLGESQGTCSTKILHYLGNTNTRFSKVK